MTRPKLLLADDSMTIRKVVELTFADEGIDVSTAADAEAAMQRFVEIQPDIVLVDIGLAGTNGYQICEMIKQDDATKHIPVLLLVGSFEPFDQDEAERAGADGFMIKPFHSIRDLVGRVSELLDRESEADTETPNTGIDGCTTDPTVEIETGDLSDGPITPETADIEELYRNSFAEGGVDETVGIDQFDTMDDLLGDTGMDDELIDASYAGDANDNNVIEFVAREEISEQTSERISEPTSEQTKEFDWSPESMITESAPALGAAAGFEPKFVFEDMPEPEDAAIFEPEAVATPEYVGEKTWEDVDTLGDREENIQPNEAEVELATENNGASAEPSAELIALIAQRVIEKLSDKVIREVAQTAVPQIAEKLIREALEDESKT